MKRIAALIILLAAVTVCFGGCKKKNEEIPEASGSGSVADFFMDISAVSDFRCEVTVDGETRTLPGEKGRKLYSQIKSSMKNAYEIDGTADENKKGISIVFLSGKKVENNENITDDNTEEKSEDEMNNIRYYGSVTVYEDDTVDFSGSPDAEIVLSYKVVSGTYASVSDSLKQVNEE